LLILEQEIDMAAARWKRWAAPFKQPMRAEAQATVDAWKGVDQLKFRWELDRQFVHGRAAQETLYVGTGSALGQVAPTSSGNEWLARIIKYLA
jgi:hypothetical protein